MSDYIIYFHKSTSTEKNISLNTYTIQIFIIKQT